MADELPGAWPRVEEACLNVLAGEAMRLRSPAPDRRISPTAKNGMVCDLYPKWGLRL